MCWAKNCCYFIKLDVGCVFIGVVSFMFSMAITVTSAVSLTLAYEEIPSKSHSSAPLSLNTSAKDLHLTKVFIFETTLATLKIIQWSAMALGLLMMISSMLLVIGVCKRKPGYVLCYFGFGIFFTIFVNLGALLLLLQQHWATSFTTFIICLLYIHFLVVVHTVYEDMVKGKMQGYHSHERLIEEDFNSEFNTDSEETGIVS